VFLAGEFVDQVHQRCAREVEVDVGLGSGDRRRRGGGEQRGQSVHADHVGGLEFDLIDWQSG
jgi:hypothetical protein